MNILGRVILKTSIYSAWYLAREQHRTLIEQFMGVRTDEAPGIY